MQPDDGSGECSQQEGGRYSENRSKGVTPVTVTFQEPPFGRLGGELRLHLTGQEESALAVPITGYATE